MYRIEVAPGEETVFRTIEELAIGIRNGVITQRARIYHNASQKWLPIGLHPHYKKALEMPASKASPAPVTANTPLPTPARKGHHPHPHGHAEVRHLEPKHPEPKHHEPKHHAEPPKLRVDPPKPQIEPRLAAEPRRSKAVEPHVRAPVQSPIVAMQREVLRDLPMLSFPEPEPLPWSQPAPQATATRAHAPPVEYAGPVREVHRPVEAAPYAPLEFAHEEAAHGAEDGELLLPRPTARRSRRVSGRPLLLLGVAASLVLGTHLLLSSTPPVSADAADAPAPSAPAAKAEDAPAAPAEPAAAEVSAPETRPAAPAPRVTTAPARVPMTPGPAFAGSVPARLDDSIALTKPPAPVAAAAPLAAPSAITPPPAALEMALPDLATDSLIPAAQTKDTLGMKKILRALNGPKPAEAPASE